MLRLVVKIRILFVLFLIKYLRVSYNGNTLAFQAGDRGSIPLTRSKINPAVCGILCYNYCN